MMTRMKTVYGKCIHNFVKLASSWFSSDVWNLCAKLHFYLWHIIVSSLHAGRHIRIDICVFVGPCHHGMARPQVADGGTASDMEGSCE